LYCDGSCQKGMLTVLSNTASGHEQLISNGERFKPAFAERDKKQAMIDLRGIPTNWFKIPPQGFLATAQTTICDRPRGLVNGFGLNFASH
jgi:hypothetical protein